VWENVVILYLGCAWSIFCGNFWVLVKAKQNIYIGKAERRNKFKIPLGGDLKKTAFSVKKK
jgi:hypothetical protein